MSAGLGGQEMTPRAGEPAPVVRIVGTRPPGKAARGAMALLRAAAGLLLGRFGRVAGLALVLLAAVVGIGIALGAPIWLWAFLTSGRLPGTAWIFAVENAIALLAATPFLVGYQYALLRMLQGKRARPLTLVAAFRSRALLLQVAAARAAGPIGALALRWLWSAIKPGRHWSLAPEHGPLRQFFDSIAQAPDAIAWIGRHLPDLVVLPLAWAGLEAFLSGCGARQAIARSARRAINQRGLLAAYAAVFVAIGIADDGLRAVHFALVQALERHFYPGGWAVMVLGSMAMTVVGMMLETTALVVFYREMVWRQRPAAEEPDTS